MILNINLFQNLKTLLQNSCKMEKHNKVKKLLYQSWYRGCKETDKIIGYFAKRYIHELSDHELSELEEILSENDNDIYDWLSNKSPMPDRFQKNSVMLRLTKFNPAEEVNKLHIEPV